jgi:pimeloyl-ACP methyl ester carboxylesterase
MAEIPEVDGVQHRFVHALGLRVHVAEAGPADAPPVLLLHGWPQHWYMWRRMMDALGGELRLLAPDLRGFGWTDAPGHGYDGETMARDQVALLDALEIDRVKVLGHDWGGWVAFLIGLLHPDRAERLMVCNAPHPWPRPSPRLVAETWRSWYAFGMAMPGIGPALLERTDFTKRALSPGSLGGTFTEDEVDLYADGMRDPARARAASSLYRYYVRGFGELLRGRWRAYDLELPTLLLFGQRDFAIPWRLVAGGDHERHAPQLRVELVPDAGHFIVDEKPELVVERARELFARGGP